MANAIWWVVIAVGAYLVVTRTTLLQSLTMPVMAQTQMPAAMDMSAAMMPAAMMNNATMNVTPTPTNINAVVPAANMPVANAKAPKMKAARNNNVKMPAAAAGNQAGAKAGCNCQKFDPRVVTSGSESGPGCGGCGNGCQGTKGWYTPGSNAQHARHHCFQGCPCCYLDGNPNNNPGGCG